MAFEGQRDVGADLSALGANFAELMQALTIASLATPRIALRLIFGLLAGGRRDSCGDVRHHYRYCCVPHCHGCGR